MTNRVGAAPRGKFLRVFKCTRKSTSPFQVNRKLLILRFELQDLDREIRGKCFQAQSDVFVQDTSAQDWE